MIEPEELINKDSLKKERQKVKFKPGVVYHNYMDEIDSLRYSDHSPVSCTFKLNVPEYWDVRANFIDKSKDVNNYEAIIKIKDIEIFTIETVTTYQEFQKPYKVQFLFPIPYETSSTNTLTVFGNSFEVKYHDKKPINML